VRHRVFLITWLTYAGYYLCRKNLSLILPALHTTTSLSDLQLANIVFGYSLFYAVGQFGFGLLADTVGAKRVVGAGLLAVVSSNLLLGVDAGFLWLLVFACCNGAGQATGWSGLVKTMASWFSPQQRGVVMAWWGTNYVLGGFLATLFATWALGAHAPFPSLGWRRGFLFPAVVLLGITALYLIGLPGSKAEALESGTSNPAPAPDERARAGELSSLLRKPALWIIGTSYFFLEFLRYALMFWLPLYLVEHLRFSVGRSGLASSAYELVGVLGAVFAGYVSDRLMHGRRAPVCAAMLGGLAVVLALEPLLSSHGFLGVTLGIAAAGIFSYGPDTLLSGAAAQDVGGPRAAATASGIIDGVGHLGALFSPYVVVFVSARFGWDTLFGVLAASALVAGAALMPLWSLAPAHDPDTEPAFQPQLDPRLTQRTS